MSGHVIYQGPSLIDGEEIVVIAVNGGRDTKTGPCVNTYILHAGLPPGLAVKIGFDSTVCGDCRHRGTVDPTYSFGKARPPGRAVGRTCYVHLPFGPSQVWNHWKAGDYPPNVSTGEGLARIVLGRHLRIGTYGDPGAAPRRLWDELLNSAGSHTGYTHRWPDLDPRAWGFLMASVDSEQECLDAFRAGWRTYRVKLEGEPIMPGESVCPGSAEAGKLTTCAKCGLCDGRRSCESVNIVINRHGTNERFYRRSA